MSDLPKLREIDSVTGREVVAALRNVAAEVIEAIARIDALGAKVERLESELREADAYRLTDEEWKKKWWVKK